MPAKIYIQNGEISEKAPEKVLKKKKPDDSFNVAATFRVSQLTAKKYIKMTKEEIDSLDNPNNYKKRESVMNTWLNVIYKMMVDGYSNETIYFYVKHQKEFHESNHKLADYIYIIGKNNFPNRIPFNGKTIVEWILPPEVIIINRSDLLKYILTCNPKTKRNATIEKYIVQIKENYPVIEKVETMFKEFHALLMGGDENKLGEYLEKYSESKIQTYCNGIKKGYRSGQECDIPFCKFWIC